MFPNDENGNENSGKNLQHKELTKEEAIAVILKVNKKFTILRFFLESLTTI